MVLMFSVSFCTLYAQQYASEMNERLGRGINLGNAFEAPSLGAWGVNPDEMYFSDIADKGFNHIRIPVKWSAHALTTAPYTINESFMDTIQWAVDQSLAYGLQVILNVHHYDEMMVDPQAHKERFLSFWEQISERFEGYTDSLYFESFNEPHDNFTPTLWNQYFAESLEVIREKHETRMVLFGTAEWGGINGLQHLQLPAEDTCIIVTVHYYNPFNFTHQGASWTANPLPTGVTWDSTAAQRNAVANDIATISNFSNNNSVPINIGEFGALQTADNESRARWTGHVRTAFEQAGFSWTYWEYSSGFGIYNSALDCHYNDVLYALTEVRGAYDCAQFDTVLIKNSTFFRSIEPWSVYVQPGSGGQATVSLVDQEARVQIISNGEEDWHIQFSYASFPLTYGSTYSITFDVYASEATDLMAQISHIGGTWGVIHPMPIEVTTTKTTFTSTFTMTEPSTQNARFVFECGISDAEFLYFDNIHVYEIEKGIPVSSIQVTDEYGNASNLVITETMGTLQLIADVLPLNASSTDIVWSVSSGALRATISQDGLLQATGAMEGTVAVRATAADGSGVYGQAIIIISGQTTSLCEIDGASCIVKKGIIPYRIPGNTILRIDKIDVMGRIIETLNPVNQNYFEISVEAAGQYFYRIQTDSTVEILR